jgi:hypothetical protein
VISIQQTSQLQMLLPIAGPLLPKQASEHAMRGAFVLMYICTIVG